jgi:hypothetical protein
MKPYQEIAECMRLLALFLCADQIWTIEKPRAIVGRENEHHKKEIGDRLEHYREIASAAGTKEFVAG